MVTCITSIKWIKKSLYIHLILQSKSFPNVLRRILCDDAFSILACGDPIHIHVLLDSCIAPLHTYWDNKNVP